MRTLRVLCGTVLGLMLLVGCTPPLHPLYEDYRVMRQGDRDARIVAALEEAGWTIDGSVDSPGIATRERVHRRWGLYKVTVWVEALPMGERHVRLLIHPYREYAWGRRSKQPYLTASIRRSLLPALHAAFASHGLEVVEKE